MTGGSTTATVLFTDVVGSSELRQRLGEDTADRLGRLHDDLLAEVVTQAGGRLVKNLGDGVLAVFTSAADAVTASVAAQQAVEAHGRREPALRFAIRAGISAGDVLTEPDGDVHGSAVVEAARLCDAAQGGQILVADLVRALARGRGGHRFEPIGDLTLKGLAEPVAACSVGWELLEVPERTTVPFPDLLAPGAGLEYVGRVALLTELADVWSTVVGAGGSRAVLLSGEPGIGKTRTATELARTAFEKGGLVLYGRCDETLGVPYQPFVEALDWQTSHDPSLPLGRLSGELVRLLPDLGQRVTDLPPAVRSEPRVEQHRLFEAVTSWLAALSHDRGVVLVVDDLHWATEPTLQLLVHVLRGVASDPQAQVLVVATYRDTDVDRTHPLSATLADMRRIPAVDRRTVESLTEDEVLQLMEVAAGHELDLEARRLADLTYHETEGNPFFIGEVLRHFIETGVVRFDQGRWIVERAELVDVPEGIRDVVGRRLDRLSPDANEVLRTAAVLGRDLDVAVLAELVDGGASAALDGLEEALRARLVEETGPDRFRFTHALVRTTLAEELSASRRRRLHARIVEALEAVRPDAVLALAHHAVQAGPTDSGLERAIRYSLAAGEHALAQRAHADAARWFTQTLELLDEHPGDDATARTTARCGLGEARRDLGDPTYRDTLLQAAREALDAGDVALAVRAVTANTRLTVSIVGAVDEERVALLERTLAALDADDPSDARSWAHIAALLSVELLTGDRGAVHRRLELADRATAIASASGDPELEARVLTLTALPNVAPDRAAQLPDRVRRAIRLADRTGDPALRCMARFAAPTALFTVGDIAGARHEIEDAVRLAVEEASPTIQWLLRCTAVQFRFYDGDIAGAHRANLACFELGQELREPDAAVWWGAVEAGMSGLEGTFGALADLYGGYADDYPNLVSWRAAQVHALADAGRHDEARTLVTTHGLLDPGTVPEDWTVLTVWSNLALAAFELGWEELGAALVPVLEPHRALWANFGIWCFLPMEVPLGLASAAAGRWDAAVEATRRGRDLLHERGLRSHAPFAAYLLSRVLSGRGRAEDRAEARAVAEAGLAAATTMGLDHRAQQLRVVLETLDGPTAPAPTT